LLRLGEPLGHFIEVRLARWPAGSCGAAGCSVVCCAGFQCHFRGLLLPLGLTSAVVDKRRQRFLDLTRPQPGFQKSAHGLDARFPSRRPTGPAAPSLLTFFLKPASSITIRSGIPYNSVFRKRALASPVGVGGCRISRPYLNESEEARSRRPAVGVAHVHSHSRLPSSLHRQSDQLEDHWQRGHLRVELHFHRKCEARWVHRRRGDGYKDGPLLPP
jgi:hypothetical protein